MVEDMEDPTPGGMASQARDANAAPSVPGYEPPRLTRLGTITEMTLGSSTTAKTDGTFPGSQFK